MGYNIVMSERKISKEGFGSQCPLVTEYGWKVASRPGRIYDLGVTNSNEDQVIFDPYKRVSQAGSAIENVCSTCTYRGRGDVIGRSTNSEGKCFPERAREPDLYPSIGVNIR